MKRSSIVRLASQIRPFFRYQDGTILKHIEGGKLELGGKTTYIFFRTGKVLSRGEVSWAFNPDFIDRLRKMKTVGIVVALLYDGEQLNSKAVESGRVMFRRGFLKFFDEVAEPVNGGQFHRILQRYLIAEEEGAW